MNKKIFALIDCNAFYVSCERVFNPKLNNRPVVALSNNDGCIIARSKEAKSLGIKMGVPLFKVKDIIQKEKVIVFSSNYTLYADMSRRVMNVISEFAPSIEIYSIDEAFIELTGFKLDYEDYARNLRATILRCTGIPVSIGIGTTKTLTKVANHIAKDNETLGGICSLVDMKNIDNILEQTKVEEVWGIGRQLSKKLIHQGVHNAKLLKYSDDQWIRKMMSINGLKTVTELRGISCLPLQEVSVTRKSCCTTRTFGKPLMKLADVEQAMTTFARRATERIRAEGLVASSVSAFLRTSPFDRRNKYYSNSDSVTLHHPTCDTIIVVHSALSVVKRIFKEGYKYKKGGILLSGFYTKGTEPPSLFSSSKSESQDLMLTIDNINQRYGSDTIQMASECYTAKWKQKRKNCTQSYTTQVSKLLLI